MEQITLLCCAALIITFRFIIINFFIVAFLFYFELEFTMMQKFEPSYLTSVNRKTVRALAESFLMQPGEYMPWLIECCSSSNLSKPLFLLVILQSFVIQKEGICFIYVSLIFLCSKTSLFLSRRSVTISLHNWCKWNILVAKFSM